MDAPWRQGGRGRARGRGASLNGGPWPAPGPSSVPVRNSAPASGPWSGTGRGHVSYASISKPVHSVEGKRESNAENSKKKFEDIQKANQAVVKKLADNYSSSDDEDDADGHEDNEGKQNRILALTFTTYTDQTDGDTSELARTKQYVNEAFQSGAVTCLICIASVKRNQAVWSCSGCYCIFHMPCIQKWAKDSIFLVSSPLTDDDFEKKDYPWPCPKCRYEYKRSQTPARYYCYCGKVEDPPLDPWLVPHSCGQVCEKEFKPSCGHKCLLLCHPGPCPPCPKMVTTTCYCKKARPVPRRCSTKDWSCRQPCGRMLLCGQHKCENPCHKGDCQPCPRVSKQKCLCGRKVSERLCASPTWQCDIVSPDASTK